MTLSPSEREAKDDAADLWCPNCRQRNTVHRPERPRGKWTGKWECVNCDWAGYPGDLLRERDMSRGDPE